MAVDKSSESFKLAKSIISDGSRSPDQPVSSKPARAATSPRLPQLADLHSISVRPAANGVTVEHTPKDPKHGGGDYSKERQHVFSDMKAAHTHIGKLLGCD